MLYLLDLSLPLKSPVLIFSLLLFIILFAPILLNRVRIPHLIGLIIAGAVIGPNGLNLMLRDSSIVLFGTVGLLYIMFLAGLEMDLEDFKKNSRRSLIFGLYTFLIPMSLGILSGLYILDMSLISSVLLASMFASHTLITYPIISKFGVSKNRAVNVTVGGTLITDTLALLVLAAIVGMNAGKADAEFWLRMGASVLTFAFVVVFFFPKIGRWFFKHFEDSISQYIFVLAMVFLAAFLAEAAGIEGIIGAFLAGLSLNKLIPHTSALMNRIEFVGNALFIPFFLIGVGMLIDYNAFIKDWQTIKVAVVMTVVAAVAKYTAAWLAQKTFGYSVDERRLIFGLSNSQAAATLAAVIIGYNIKLFDESVLNGTIVMILITCTMASFVTQKGARNIALAEAGNSEDGEDEERILIPMSNIDNVEKLINLSVTIKSKQAKNALYALNIITDKQNETSQKNAEKILDKAITAASATDNKLQKLIRYDANPIHSISQVVREQRITDLIMGIHKQQSISDSFLGSLTEGILSKCNVTTLIYRPIQPIATLKRHVILIPERAEREIGFPFWLVKIWNIARNTGSQLVFYANKTTLDCLKNIQQKHPINCEFNEFGNWDDFLIFTRYLRTDDNFIITMSRPDKPSYHKIMDRIPYLLNTYFTQYSYILVYPIQSGISDDDGGIDLKNPSLLEPYQDLQDISQTISKLFKWK
jgi:Kef-type K+ transport system membrane component KefB/nucleotide-binding universal stress UspA family protein